VGSPVPCRARDRFDLSATSIPHHDSIQPGAERLCEQAEALIASLTGENVPRGYIAAVGPDSSPGGPLELVVDGYAHVLALDVDRRRLEREVARLAEAGDPGMAARLGELSGLLRRMTRVSEDLRARLDLLRARLEGARPGGPIGVRERRRRTGR
jgi:hypothetical protein